MFKHSRHHHHHDHQCETPTGRGTKKPASPPQLSHNTNPATLNPTTPNQPNTDPPHPATQTQTHHTHNRENKIEEGEGQIEVTVGAKLRIEYSGKDGLDTICEDELLLFFFSFGP